MADNIFWFVFAAAVVVAFALSGISSGLTAIARALEGIREEMRRSRTGVKY